MPYLGSWQIDDLLTFPANTHDAGTGAATDADAVPAYRVYEDETGTAILTGNMAKLDDANTTGFYSEQLTLSAANGFEVGKSYTIYISAAVDSITGTANHTFQVEAALATQASVDTIDSNVDAILVDTGTTLQAELDGIQADTEDIQTRLPAALVSGRIDASVGAMAADVLTATAIAADAITAAKVAADVTAEIQTGLATADDIADAVWNEAQSGHTTAGTFGEIATEIAAVLADTGTDGVIVGALNAAALADFFDTDSGTTYASAVAGSVVKETADNAGGSALTVADIADGVWDELQSGHVAAGSFGEVATEIASILVDTGTTLDGKIDTIDSNVDAILVDTGTTLQAELDAIQAAVITNAAGVDIAADIIAVKAETAAILADTDDIGVAGAGLTALATQASVDTIDANVDAILLDTAEIGAAGAGLTALATQASVDTVDGNVDAILVDTGTTLPATLTTIDTVVDAVKVKTDLLSDAALNRLDRAASTEILGTCDSGSTTTAIVASALDPASGVDDQFNGRVVIFAADTTTANLRGQATVITDFDHTSQTFTVEALTDAPASGDTFVVV